LSNQKALFVAREHEINRDITPYVGQFTIPGEHGGNIIRVDHAGQHHDNKMVDKTLIVLMSDE
jgi:hypothetical protein